MTIFQNRRPAELVRGLLLTLFIAAAAFITWWLLKGTWLTVSALLWAFIYSIVLVNLFPKLTESQFKPGVEFTSSRLLRFAIGILGLTISAAVWVKMGPIGLIVALANLAFSFGFGLIFCKYVMKMDSPLAVLIAVGTSICGSSAIAATAPAIRAKAEQIGLAVAVVTLFGLIAMFAYPFLYNGPLASFLGQNRSAFGMWAGTGIHDTADVIAAASQVDGATSLAMSAKSVRILMIGPMVILSALLFRRLSQESLGEKLKVSTPWFAIAFIAFTLVNFAIASSPVGGSWSSFDSKFLSPAVTFLLAWSFAGVGFKVRFSSIASIGVKTFLGGMAAAVVAGGVSLLLVKLLWMPFA
ncbi:MAG: putative sulfate exporter family transporter [Chloroflexi bacterium]|nr:putative sulfate exporter family transporter [Chloroflexota bacterium]